MTSTRESFAVVSEATLRKRRAFDAWAAVYDSQPNPLLTLEERYLKGLLPEIAGRSVLDAGCGSGRWLRYLADYDPDSLKGIDPSREMLRAAAGKNTSAELLVGSCEEVPFPHESFDLIISSFVLSYVGDLSRSATELHRVARGGCDLLLSDMHPDTQRILGWKRSFAVGSRKVELDAKCFALDEIIGTFTRAGWKSRMVLSPEFGVPERQLFESLGGLQKFHAAGGHPAIYLLHFQKLVGAEAQDPPATCNSELPDARVLRRATRAIGPADSQATSSAVARSRIVSITNDRMCMPLATQPAEVDIDLSGYLLLPGLINAHDHLEFALFPRLGTRRYNNATEWAEDIHKHFADVIALHRTIPMSTRLLWGGLRNLLCGVTTVCHHNPFSPELESDDFPVQVVQRYGWAHSLRFCNDLKAAREATPVDVPFLVHACEGTDSLARDELRALDNLGILNSQSIMIHGLALDAKGAELLRSRGVSLIVCPSSNLFLFGEVPSSEVLEGVGAIALGSDSPLTSCGDLLDEIRFAAQHCGLSSRRIYSMVTQSPAAMLHLPDGSGSPWGSAPCDVIAVRDRGLRPDETLCSLSFVDIELVLRKGRVFLASEGIVKRLPAVARRGLEPLSIAGTIRWLRAPVVEMLREAEAALGRDRVKLGGKDVQAVDRHFECDGEKPPQEHAHAG
jgi:cytosine/adenosine deaminase-related metal-dependent hydrolase/SAM-dependent methyltransferase